MIIYNHGVYIYLYICIYIHSWVDLGMIPPTNHCYSEVAVRSI